MGELEALQVREEVLQAMYWMRAEGLAESPAATELSRFLAVPAETLMPFLARFAEEAIWNGTETAFDSPPRAKARQALLR
jgi:hypothetical protein